MKSSKIASERALALAKINKGFLRAKEARLAGIHSRTLAGLKDQNKIELLARGIYKLKASIPLSNPDLVTVSLVSPRAVICLISALSFHRITTQIPHRVYLAVPQNFRSPKSSYPSIEVHWFGEEAYSKGIEEHLIDGVRVKVYDREKSIVDCFKFRNKIGMDIFLEAVKMYRSARGKKVNEILRYAKICRVEKQITPYLEALFF